MWSEMSYNKYRDDLTSLQRLLFEYDDGNEDEYIGDFDELDETNISLFC